MPGPPPVASEPGATSANGRVPKQNEAGSSTETSAGLSTLEAAGRSLLQDPDISEPAVPIELPVVTRLRQESAPLAEWRREAISRYAEARYDEVVRILDAVMESDSLFSQHPAVERLSTMRLLAACHISRVLSCPDSASGDALLSRAWGLLERADTVDTKLGSPSAVEAFINKGYHSLVLHAVHPEKADELKRADLLFSGALRLDGHAPRALLGRAVVYCQWKEWNKSLALFRQVLARAAPASPRSGLRLKSLKQLRFALAQCFCNLGRFEHMKHALEGVIAADPSDVESLCALAHLEAKVSKDGVGRSMEYLDEAVKANQHHPVVLCQLANHAFYCGLEECTGDSNGKEESAGQSPWELAAALLTRALAASKSAEVQAEAHYQMGRLRHAQEQYTEAYEEYKKSKDLNPENYACMHGLAQTCIKQNKLDEAISTLEAVRKARGNLPEVLKLLTYAYITLGNKAKEAVACADILVTKSNDDLEAWAMRAEAHHQLAATQPDHTVPKAGVDTYEHVARILSNGDTHRQASPQIWNNLGTLRGLQGDSGGAREAYTHGIELAERRLQQSDLAPEEAKDLVVAHLTMRFNRAWLAENSGDQPDFMEATREYISIREDHNWYADTLLRLGSQWQRIGDVERAAQTYEEAMKQNPVLASLMQAEVYRQQGGPMYSKALQAAEMAVQRAGEKQFHYAHVYLGNLYFQVACNARISAKDRDANMCKALWNYTRALEHEKDSHYAANGIGMVFAQRGKLDFAKRTFQSVMQHHAMQGDPSVYINLGHTYLKSGGDNARKAIALYQRAKKMKPNDLAIRLYLAKAHFGLKEFERCAGILGDAMQIWPDDLLLRYNLAISLENFGVYLVTMEKKTQRVVGVDSGMDQMTCAVELLASAARVYEYVQSRWAIMSDEDKKQLAARSGSPANLAEEMHRVHLHKEYCADIADKAKEQLQLLKKLRSDMDIQMRKITEDKAERQKMQQQQEEEAQVQDQERRLEMEEQALRLMESTNDIQLGKNLESVTEQKPKQAKDPKPKAPAKGKKGAPPAPDAVDDEGLPIEGGPLAEGEAPVGGTKRKHEKEKKDKKDKKAKKKEKKDKKKRKLGDSEGGNDSDMGEEQEGEGQGEMEEQPPAADDEEADLFGDAPDDAEKEGKKDKKDKKDKKEKKDKSGKKEKKQKKEKKDKKEKDGGEKDEELMMDLFEEEED